MTNMYTVNTTKLMVTMDKVSYPHCTGSILPDEKAKGVLTSILDEVPRLRGVRTPRREQPTDPSGTDKTATTSAVTRLPVLVIDKLA